MKILYFASIKQVIGISEENIELKNTCSINELINILKRKDEKYEIAFKDLKNIKCAVNCSYENLNKVVKNNDEIAFFPPVTGG